MTWLEDLLGIKDLWSDGVALAPRRKALEFISGAGVALALVDDPATGRSKLTISAAGGGGSGSSDYRESVRVATTGALPAYTRVGNVLTANANGALPAIDGVTLTVGARRVLLWHGASAVDNGTYDVTQMGDGSTPWILTRTVDGDGNTETFTDGARVPIAEGTLYAGRTFKVTTNDPIVLNTTAITWAPDAGLPDGTATDQIAKWNGTTWIAGALNLAAAAAVTGVLAVANGGTGLAALGAANTVAKVKSDGTVLEYGKLTTANLDAAAGIVGTQLAAGANILGSQLSAAAGIVGTQLAAGANILGSQLSATAAIAASQLADGGANTVLQGGTPNTWTATPTVTTLNATTVAATNVTASGYIALGADPADAGAIRLSHAMGIYGESNTPGTDRAVLTWGVVGNDVVGLGDAGTVTRVTGSALHAYVGAAKVLDLSASALSFTETVSGPVVEQSQRTSDAETNHLTIQAQSAWASAVSNRDGGNLYLRAGDKATGGTDGSVLLGTASGTLVQVHRAASTYCGFTAGGIASSGFGFYANNSGQSIFFQALGTSGSIQLSSQTILAHYGASGSTIFQASGTTWSLQITAATGASSFVHNARVTDAATSDLTIQAQNAWSSATGSNRKGGDLLLKAGQTTSGGTVSKVRLWSGATNGTLVEAVQIYYESPTSLSTIDGTSNLMIRPSVSGSIYLRSGSTSGDLVIDQMGTGTMYVRTGGGADICLTAASKNVSLFAVGSYGGGVKVLFGANATTEPTSDPVGGGLVWWYGGAFKGRGSSGTVTTIAAAEPHCPVCGNDYVFEARNDKRGHHVAICWPCFLDEAHAHGLDRSKFAFIDQLGKAA